MKDPSAGTIDTAFKKTEGRWGGHATPVLLI